MGVIQFFNQFIVVYERHIKKEAVIRVQKAINDFDKNLKIQILNETARTASDAAKALNCNVGAIVKSLLQKQIMNLYCV